MEKYKIFELLEKVNYFHDSNFQSINIDYHKYSDDAPEGYIKDCKTITIIINLPDNEDKCFDNKTISLSFYDVMSFFISNDSYWDWMIDEAKISIYEKYNIFSIDTQLRIIYKTFNWKIYENGAFPKT